MTTETYEKTFAVIGIPTVKVGNIRGKIEVSPGEADQVYVKAVKHLDGDPDRTEVKIYQNEEGHIIIETKYHEGVSGWLRFRHCPSKVEYTVIVPETCNLSVRNVSGEAIINGLAGDIQIGTSVAR